MQNNPHDPVITVTKEACAYIAKMLSKEQGIGLRITLKKTGCSGYSYQPLIVRAESVNQEDILLIVPNENKNNEIKIYLDAKWQSILQGLMIDYVAEEKNGLRQKKLVFINHNETSRCGCGESFTVEEVKHVS